MKALFSILVSLAVSLSAGADVRNARAETAEVEAETNISDHISLDNDLFETKLTANKGTKARIAAELAVGREEKPTPTPAETPTESPTPTPTPSVQASTPTPTPTETPQQEAKLETEVIVDLSAETTSDTKAEAKVETTRANISLPQVHLKLNLGR